MIEKSVSKTDALKGVIFAILEEPPCQGCRYMETYGQETGPRCYRQACIGTGRHNDPNERAVPAITQERIDAMRIGAPLVEPEDIGDCPWVISILKVCQKMGLMYVEEGAELPRIEMNKPYYSYQSRIIGDGWKKVTGEIEV